MLLKIPTWLGMALGISFGSFGNYAISTWVIDYYVRAFAGLDITQAKADMASDEISAPLQREKDEHQKTISELQTSLKEMENRYSNEKKQLKE